MIHRASRPVRFAAIVLALVAAGAANGSAQSKEQQQTMAELQILKDQMTRLQDSVKALVDDTATLAGQLRDAQARLDQQDRQATRGFADAASKMNGIVQAVQALLAKVTDNSVNVRTLQQEVLPIRQSIAAAVDAINQSRAAALAGVGAAPAPPPAGAASAVPPAAPTGTPTANDAWAAAFDHYADAEYDQAIAALRDFVKTFPQAPQICDAQRLIAESRRGQKRYTDAVTAFDVIVGGPYPTSDCAARALLGLADVYSQDLKQNAKAIETYRTIVSRMPQQNPSDAWQVASLVAAQRLKALTAGRSGGAARRP